MLYDSHTHREFLRDVDYEYRPLGLGTRTITFGEEVPANFVPGPEEYRALPAYHCNPLQKYYWPITRPETVLRFDIADDTRQPPRDLRACRAGSQRRLRPDRPHGQPDRREPHRSKGAAARLVLICPTSPPGSAPRRAFSFPRIPREAEMIRPRGRAPPTAPSAPWLA